MSFKAEPLRKKSNYYSIKDASFRLTSNSDNPEAIRREYTNPKTKEDGVVYELAYKALYGTITAVSFHDNTLDDGTVLHSMHITLGEDENGVAQIISIPTDSRYATDFLKRLPMIDPNKEIRLMPYDIEKDGPRQVGIAVHQIDMNGNYTDKIDNKFFTKVEEKDGKKVYTSLHGFPEPTDDDKSDWPFYFKKVNKFLVKYAQENVLQKFQDKKPIEKIYEGQAGQYYPSDDISPEDIPF